MPPCDFHWEQCPQWRHVHVSVRAAVECVTWVVPSRRYTRRCPCESVQWRETHNRALFCILLGRAVTQQQQPGASPSTRLTSIILVPFPIKVQDDRQLPSIFIGIINVLHIFLVLNHLVPCVRLRPLTRLVYTRTTGRIDLRNLEFPQS